VVGLSWMLPPYQWRFGAVATQSTQAAVVQRLQATRARLIEVCTRLLSLDEADDLR
jgi:hypothetical protein